jgi:glycosyltransferase involved in cell wall biosynthesis
VGVTKGILALLPFIVNGALSMIVLRALRARGMDISVAYYQEGAQGYSTDAAEDFRAEGRLLTVSPTDRGGAIDQLEGEIVRRDIGLLLQIGSPWAYRQLPYVKERCPGLRLVDILYNKVGHSLNHFLYENCFDGVIVESEDMRRFVFENTRKTDPGVQLVESGIDLDAFSPAAPVSGAPFTIGYFGRMSPEKNPFGFVALAERLHKRLPDVRFRMFGEGPQADAVRARVEASVARSVLSYDGFVAHPCDALSCLHVLVVPSLLDGRPNVVMEANACGVPVIGAPVGGIPELIEPGRNGLLLGPAQPDEIAIAVEEWMGQSARYSTLRANCRATAEERFDRNRMFDRYEEVFRGFLSSAGRGQPATGSYQLRNADLRAVADRSEFSDGEP